MATDHSSNVPPGIKVNETLVLAHPMSVRVGFGYSGHAMSHYHVVEQTISVDVSLIATACHSISQSNPMRFIIREYIGTREFASTL